MVDKLGIAIFSSITLVTAGLGIWQLQRYDEKVLKIQDAKKKLKGDAVTIHPLEISQASLTASLLQHRNQQVNLGRGKYQHDREVFLGLRPGPAGRLGPRAQGMATNPQVSNEYWNEGRLYMYSSVYCIHNWFVYIYILRGTIL